MIMDASIKTSYVRALEKVKVPSTSGRMMLVEPSLSRLIVMVISAALLYLFRGVFLVRRRNILSRNLIGTSPFSSGAQERCPLL